MDLKEQIANAIEAGFEYCCDKEDGHFYKEDIAEYVVQVVNPFISELVDIYGDSKDFVFWYNKTYGETHGDRNNYHPHTVIMNRLYSTNNKLASIAVEDDK